MWCHPCFMLQLAFDFVCLTVNLGGQYEEGSATGVGLLWYTLKSLGRLSLVSVGGPWEAE